MEKSWANRRWLAWALALLVAWTWGCSRATDDEREARTRYMRRAYAARNAQDVDGALRWCRVAIEHDPDLALAHRELALLLDNYLEDYEYALYHYRRYLELRPHSDKRPEVESLIRRCRSNIAAQVAEFPTEWRQYLAARAAHVRNLELEVAALRQAAANRSDPPPAAAPASTAPTPLPPAAPALRTHVTQAGETLGTISARYYGTPAKWKQIYDANRDRMSNPNNVRVGISLVIPDP
jgi:LysM repeat protein